MAARTARSTPRGAVACGEPGRGGPVLADGQQLRAQVPGPEQGRGRAVRRGQVGPCVHPVAVDQPGLGAVHRPDRRRRFGGQPGLALRGQRQLYVDQDARGSARDGRGRRVRADPAPGHDRHVDAGVGEQLLEQDEGGGSAHPAAGLVPLGEDRRGTGGHRGTGLRPAGDLGPHPGPPGRSCPVGHPLRAVLGGVGEQHRVHLGRQLRRPERAARGHPHPVAPPGADPAGELREGGRRCVGVPAEVEQPEGAGSFGGDHDAGLRLLEGAERDHQVARVGGVRVRVVGLRVRVAGLWGRRGLGGHGRSSLSAVSRVAGLRNGWAGRGGAPPGTPPGRPGHRSEPTHSGGRGHMGERGYGGEQGHGEVRGTRVSGAAGECAGSSPPCRWPGDPPGWGGLEHWSIPLAPGCIVRWPCCTVNGHAE